MPKSPWLLERIPLNLLGCWRGYPVKQLPLNLLTIIKPNKGLTVCFLRIGRGLVELSYDLPFIPKPEHTFWKICITRLVSMKIKLLTTKHSKILEPEMKNKRFWEKNIIHNKNIKKLASYLDDYELTCN